MSTTEAVPASSFDTNRVVPSRLMSKFSGSDPPGSTRETAWLAASTTAMPSFDLSALSFSHSSSGMVGGHLGEPLSATKTVRPSWLTRTPRGRVPTGMVAIALSAPRVDDGELLRVLVGDVGEQRAGGRRGGGRSGRAVRARGVSGASGRLALLAGRQQHDGGTRRQKVISHRRSPCRGCGSDRAPACGPRRRRRGSPRRRRWPGRARRP